MAEVWMPGIHHDRGALANYERGRNREQAVKLHYTVGVNSAPIGKQGYFQFLVPRSGTPIQFAPADAVNWDSGDWNDAGPGIEFEYYEPKDGPHPANIVTDSQIEWGGKIVRWLSEQRGYPLAFYDGPRISESSGFRGFITHRSLVQSEQHYDYITAEQFARMIEGDDVTPEQMKQLGDWMQDQTDVILKAVGARPAVGSKPDEETIEKLPFFQRFRRNVRQVVNEDSG